MSAFRTPTKGSIIVQAFAQSDVGRTRDHNEDAFVVANLGDARPVQFDGLLQRSADARGTLFMVADGMGGAAAGEVASATATDTVLRYLHDQWTEVEAKDPATFVKVMAKATEVANAAIFQYATEHPELRGMGTTATIAGLLGDTLYVAQVGDSRAYLIRDGVAHQITKDQSLIQKLIEAGEMSEAEAELSERRNIILQALGPEAHVRVELTHQEVRRGDTLILCSDGLSGLVKSDIIARIVTEEVDPARICQRLISLANELGGPDNITVVATRFDGEGLRSASSGDAVGHRIFSVGTGHTPTEERAIREAATSPVGIAVVDEARRKRGELYVRTLSVIGFLAIAYVVWRWLV